MWIQNKSIYEITNYCEYEDDSNFIKNIIKINNILENIKSICTIIEDYDLLYKIQDLYKILIRDLFLRITICIIFCSPCKKNFKIY